MDLDIEGFYGFFTRLVAAWIALFLLYAGLLQGYGAFNLILRASVRLTCHITSGVAQTAVLRSMIIGSINGSQSPNAGMTGSFTILLMKDSGIKVETTGGIESVASTAGQVLPPVMDAGPFVMASLLGIRYIEVVQGGLIPAVILEIVITVAVHYVATNEIDDPNFEAPPELEETSETNFYLEAVRVRLPFGVLIYTLGVIQWTIMTSALYTVISMIATCVGITNLSHCVR